MGCPPSVKIASINSLKLGDNVIKKNEHYKVMSDHERFVIGFENGNPTKGVHVAQSERVYV
jgi:hypothetical protein